MWVNNMGIIYKIENKRSGKIYIGQTRRTLKQRICEHMKNRHHYHIECALQKYGVDAFDISVVENVPDYVLNERERYWISYYGCVTPMGYNNTYGGEGGIPTEETKKKISDSLKGKMAGKNNPMYGTISPMRGKQSPMKGRKHNEETIKKMIASRTGENSKSARPIVCIETNTYYISAKQASDNLGINRSCLCAAVKGIQKTAGKLHWRYATEEEIKIRESITNIIIRKG